jgi:lysyl-tRNA synthetase class 2
VGTRVLQLSTEELASLASQLKVSINPANAPRDRDGWLNLILAERVEPWLASQRAIFLCDYPASQCALARVRQGESPVSERFELYLDGLEICNGYQELTDPDELARRMNLQAERRRAAGLVELPTESRLLEAMRQGLPECSGVALGFDRLVMWRLGAACIDDVIPFPLERA